MGFRPPACGAPRSFHAAASAWAALLAAISPFFLWYGQEARPYALWGLLALLSTYLLLRWVQTESPAWPWLAGYAATLAMFLSSHYYAVFLLPVHAGLIYLRLARRRRVARLVIVVVGLLLGGAALAGAVFWVVLFAQQGGDNFSSISLRMLVPDVLNAFSLGLSVDLADVWLIDLLFGAVAVTGAAWSLRSRRSLQNGGWLPVAMIGLPILAILAIDAVFPAYMTARHMSLLGGPFILLLGAGLGAAWQWRPLAVAAARAAACVGFRLQYGQLLYAGDLRQG